MMKLHVCTSQKSHIQYAVYLCDISAYIMIPKACSENLNGTHVENHLTDKCMELLFSQSGVANLYVVVFNDSVKINLKNL